MEGCSRPPKYEVSLPEFLAETDLESELSPELAIKEEMIEEVMQELYKEITCPESTCTEERPASLPSPSFSRSLSAPFFVESGKSESCGASMSDSASSVMAGVEFAGGLLGSSIDGKTAEEWGLEEEEGLLGERLMDGCDAVEFGDEWLEKVMGWTPLDVEGWT